jgi:hypothetical protein
MTSQGARIELIGLFPQHIILIYVCSMKVTMTVRRWAVNQSAYCTNFLIKHQHILLSSLYYLLMNNKIMRASTMSFYNNGKQLDIVTKMKNLLYWPINYYGRKQKNKNRLKSLIYTLSLVIAGHCIQERWQFQ